VAPAVRAGKRGHPYGRRRPRKSRSGPVLGAIDVGTNACRLLIAVPDGEGAAMPRVIDSYTVSVRLGEGLERAGSIMEAALDRTVEALRVCSERLKRNGVTHVRAIATEACRRASNAQELIDRAQNEAGIALTIVTPEEEARLAAEGCLPLIGADFEGALIFDIGGGSTELILVRVSADRSVHEIVAWASAPVGVVSLAERYGAHNLSAEVYAEMRQNIRALFRQLRSELGNGTFDAARYHLLGTSGTLTTLAGVKLGLLRYSRSRIDGQWLSRDDVLGIMGRISSRDFDGRADIPCIGTDRADLILPGCAILAEIMENWPCGHLRVADRGLREGLLIGLLKEASAAGTSARAARPHRASAALAK
jgi:exopolyphosphatase / guanosine-5'-triphosphate,3'-diphosphate pyrophosphatase